MQLPVKMFVSNNNALPSKKLRGTGLKFCITKHSSAFYRDGQGPPIIDVLGYDGQNSSFSSPSSSSSSSSSPPSDSTPITQKRSHIST